MSEVSQSDVAQAILAYLADNPHAQDTLAGIAEWWLPERQVKTQIATIKEALATLVAEGLVLERKGKDSQIHYRINSRRLREITVMLQ
jgi:Fe2+ or Zn2+ uptake regulation protein